MKVHTHSPNVLLRPAVMQKCMLGLQIPLSPIKL
jgi:hypothetical protein